MKSYLATVQDAVLVDAVETTETLRAGAKSAYFGHNLRLSTIGLEAYFFSEWHPELVDLLVVAAAVEFCDLSCLRPARGWGRSFDVRVAVHNPMVWNKIEARESLEDALNFLTGDAWTFSFVQRRVPEREVPRHTLDLGAAAKVIMPYSDGLDSRAVAALIAADETSLVRVRLGTKGSDKRSTRRQRLAFAAVPYEVKLGKRDRVESSARSRGFKFAVITGIAAHLASADRIVVTESGQGALGPVMAVSGHGYPDYRVHPAFSRKIECLFRVLTGQSAHFEYPRIWYTKGETLAAANSLSAAPSWNDARSCWQQARQIGFDGRLRQCGICAACLLRRMSMHAAGIEEATDEYVWEDLSQAGLRDGAAPGFTRFTKSLDNYAIAGVLHLDHLAALASSSLHRRALKRVAREVGDALGLPSEKAEEKLHDLLKRHAAEWRAFLGSLGPNSFVTRIATVSS